MFGLFDRSRRRAPARPDIAQAPLPKFETAGDRRVGGLHATLFTGASGGFTGTGGSDVSASDPQARYDEGALSALADQADAREPDEDGDSYTLTQERTVYRGQTLTGRTLDDIDFRSVAFIECQFVDCKLTKIDLIGCDLIGCVFTRCAINFTLDETLIEHCRFLACEIYDLSNRYREFNALLDCEFGPIVTRVNNETTAAPANGVVRLGIAYEDQIETAQSNTTVDLRIEPCRIFRLELWSGLLGGCWFNGVANLQSQLNVGLDTAILASLSISPLDLRDLIDRGGVREELGHRTEIKDVKLIAGQLVRSVMRLDIDKASVVEADVRAECEYARLEGAQVMDSDITLTTADWASVREAVFAVGSQIALNRAEGRHAQLYAADAVFSPSGLSDGAKMLAGVTAAFDRLQALYDARSGAFPEAAERAELLKVRAPNYLARISDRLALFAGPIDRRNHALGVSGSLFDTPAALLLEWEAMRKAATDPDAEAPARGTADHLMRYSPVDLSAADFSGASLAGASLRNAYAPGARFDEANLERVDVRGSVFCHHSQAASFKAANLSDAKFAGAMMRGADFTGADLSSAVFSGDGGDGRRASADIRHAVFSGARGFVGTEFTNLDLTGVKLPDDLRDFGALSSIERLSVQARNLLAIALLGSVYCVLSMITLRGAREYAEGGGGGGDLIVLPILEVGVPSSWFAGFAVLSLLGLSAYFHSKLQAIWAEIMRLPARFPDGRRAGSHIYPFIVTALATPIRAVGSRDRVPGQRWLAYLVERGGALLAGWVMIPAVIATIIVLEAGAGAPLEDQAGLVERLTAAPPLLLVGFALSVLVSAVSLVTMWTELRREPSAPGDRNQD